MNISFVTALIIDICLQCCVGLIDLFATSKFYSIVTEKTAKLEFKDFLGANGNAWYWRMTSAVMLLTVGIQVVIFNISYHVSEPFGSYILAFFYVGVAMAALFCSVLKVRLEWHHFENKNLSRPMICHNAMKMGVRFSFMTVLAIGCVLCAVSGSVLNLNNSLMLMFVAMSAFLYEILALAIIDRIGLENSSINKQMMVMRCYGLMGVGAAVSLWVMGMIGHSRESLFLVVTMCLVSSVLLLRNRALIQ